MKFTSGDTISRITLDKLFWTETNGNSCDDDGSSSSNSSTLVPVTGGSIFIVTGLTRAYT